MKGLVVNGDGKVILASDIPMPEIDDYQVVTKTIACGICNGTDLKLVEGKLRGFGSYPAVLGHESVGEVIQVGRKVRNLKVGDRVLRTVLKETDQYHSLWGSFAQFGYADDYMARIQDGVPADVGVSTHQVIPRQLDPVDGTMIITLKEICSALHRLGLAPGMNVVVVGCGPVGLSMVALARLMGAGKVIMSGHHPSRLAVAKKLGADVAFSSKEQDVVETVRQHMPEGVDLFIDCVGRTSIIDQGMQVVKETGKIGLYGIGIHTGDLIDWDRAPYNFNIHSVQWPIPLEEKAVHEEVIGYLMDGKLNLKDFVSHTLPVEAFEEGFDLVRSREGLKVALTFGTV